MYKKNMKINKNENDELRLYGNYNISTIYNYDYDYMKENFSNSIIYKCI